MKLLKDVWDHLKEWNEWGMKDWIKAGIIVIVVLVVLKIILIPGAKWYPKEKSVIFIMKPCGVRRAETTVPMFEDNLDQWGLI